MKAVITLENEKEINRFMAGKNTQPQSVEDTEDEERTFTKEQSDRYEIASDLATVCEYLEDSEIIKIRLIVSKCKARKDRVENE
nr:MAG TPA: hypothetical protein [Caudoviricetes sp.]